MQVCSNDEHRLTFDLFKARSNLHFCRSVFVWMGGGGVGGAGGRDGGEGMLKFFFQYVFKTNG